MPVCKHKKLLSTNNFLLNQNVLEHHIVTVAATATLVISYFAKKFAKQNFLLKQFYDNVNKLTH